MHKPFLILGAFLSALAVILGAFGAHGLKKIVPAETIATFETGVRYHVYHGFALLITGMLFEKFRNNWTKAAGWCFVTGIVLFSGSLYILTLMKSSGSVGLKGIGMITPVGGLFFMAGWIMLIVSFLTKRQSSLKSI